MSRWTLEQVAKHKSLKSCWVIIQNKVYDVTEFLPEHPGGAAIILKHAGCDATAVYEPIHPPDALEKNLPPSKHLGSLTTDAAQSISIQKQRISKTKDEIRIEEARRRLPPLSRILSLADMEKVARGVLSQKALAYYSSAADDELTHYENAAAFSRFFFNARVMRAVANCDPSTKILGYRSSIPVFVSGAALAKLGHPQGEANITKAAAKESIIQMVSSNASLSPDDIIAAAESTQPLFFQLYKHRDDEIAEKRVRHVEKLGYKAIFLTVDAIVAGNRERDIRSPWEAEEDVAPQYWSESEGTEEEANVFGTAGALVANDDRDMTWEKTIPWLRSITKLPVVIKGIQSVEDALLAAEANVDGILISNHGGRQLEYSLPPMEILYVLQRHHPELFEKMEVYIDGGISRGTDVVKALCLGATAVGLGRPFLYSQSAYGAAGVVKLIEILRREILTTMRLLGASSVNELTPNLIHRIDWQPHPRAKL